MDARRAAERVDRQAGVIGQHEIEARKAVKPSSDLCGFFDGVGGEGVAVLDDLRSGGKLGQGLHGKTVAQNRGDFFGLVGVAAGDEEGGHAGQVAGSSFSKLSSMKVVFWMRASRA